MFVERTLSVAVVLHVQYVWFAAFAADTIVLYI